MRRIQFLQRGRSGMVRRWPQSVLVAASITAILLPAGCAEKRARAYPWATAITVRSHAPILAPGYTPPQIDESTPDLPRVFAQPTGLVVSSQQARTRVTVQPTPVLVWCTK